MAGLRAWLVCCAVNAALAVEFDVLGHVLCDVDDQYMPFTTGTVALFEYDIIGDDFMGDTELRNNTFHLHFSDDELFDLRPFLVIKHDCDDVLRAERNRPRPSGCRRVAHVAFAAPAPAESVVQLNIQLNLVSEPRLLCPDSATLRH